MRVASKADLLHRIQGEHSAFLTLAGSIPEAQYQVPGVWGDGWSVLDLFAHLTDWEQLFLTWFRLGQRGADPPRPAPGYTWRQTPALNHMLQASHRGEPWHVTRWRFDHSYRQVLRLTRRLTTSQLLTPGAFRWTGRLPLVGYLGPNTFSHYRTAQKILARWLRGTRCAGATVQAPRPSPAGANHRMKLASSAIGFLRPRSTRPSTRSLARTRLGAQLMRGR